MDRPMTSHEIQKQFGRMPTKQERSAFSSWRERNPDTPLTPEDAARADAQKKAEEERWRYLPASWRICTELAEIVGEDASELIKKLVKAMIEEDRYDHSPD